MILKKMIGAGAIAGALGFSAIGLAAVANAAPAPQDVPGAIHFAPVDWHGGGGPGGGHGWGGPGGGGRGWGGQGPGWGGPPPAWGGAGWGGDGPGLDWGAPPGQFCILGACV
jgi:hypothetical protein